MVAEIAGFQGKIVYETSKPDGYSESFSTFRGFHPQLTSSVGQFFDGGQWPWSFQHGPLATMNAASSIFKSTGHRKLTTERLHDALF
jgi:hypothetical protein